MGVVPDRALFKCHPGPAENVNECFVPLTLALRPSRPDYRNGNMTNLRDLPCHQINEAIGSALERKVPVAVTFQHDGAWWSVHSRVVHVEGAHLLLEFPRTQDGQAVPALQPADRAGVSFKLKHHKHIFTATVVGVEEAPDPNGGGSMRVLRVCSPTKMLRLQRRMFQRVDVPPNRIVRASFWLGGCSDEPSGTTPDRPVWSGRVVNLSAGGFQVATGDDVGPSLEVGDNVGVRIAFGAADETVYANAQFRHLEEVGGQRHLGFQFVGLAQSHEGRDALQLIGGKVAQYQREADRA